MGGPFFNMSLQYYIVQLSQFEIKLADLIKEIVKANKGDILFKVKQRLYQTGRDGTGAEITPTYQASTIKRKKEQGRRSSFVTLRNEGLFYKGFYLELQGYTVVLNSSDSKTSHLIDKYGRAILEFTKQEQDFITSIIDTGIENKLAELTFNSSSAGGIEVDTF